MKIILIIILNMLAVSCNQKHEVKVVSSVDLNRYTGTWYEIARLPNSFEKDLICTTANYTLRPDGRITVLNKGRKTGEMSKERSAKGVAWIPDKSAPTKLKVRFFWPFSGDYWILSLDKDYRFALIGEPGRKYLWILSREKRIDDVTYKSLLDTAVLNGYNVSQIIKVDQGCK